MDYRTTTISAAFSKEADSRHQAFLMFLSRIGKKMMRLAMADLRISYLMLTHAPIAASNK